MPKDIEDRIRREFGDEDAEVIVRNWAYCSQMPLGRASWAQIRREARAVLSISRDPELGPKIPGNPALRA